MASSNEAMPSTGRFHVNSSTDIHQQPSYTADHHVKYVTNANSTPFTTTVLDGEHNRKIENADLSKKMFMDRQIKKAKGLSGLIKGTALSRHMPLQPTPYTDPVIPTPSANTIHEDLQSPVVTNHDDDDDDASPTRRHHEQSSEPRRPRVSFSDFHKIQYFEDSTPHHRHRYRSARKPTTIVENNHIPPSVIQQSQVPNVPARPLSRQQPVGHESYIKKQPLVPSPRAYLSRMTHLPDILPQPLPTEVPMYEKYGLHREKPLLGIPEPAAEISTEPSAEVSRESTRASGVRPIVSQDSNDQNYKLEAVDRGLRTSLSNSSISSLLTNRQRPPLRTISLRQQFTAPIRSKTTNILHSPQTSLNPRRSGSVKHPATRVHPDDDDLDEINDTELLSAFGHRPMTSVSSSRQLRRNYIIHFDSKNPFNRYTTADPNDTNHRFTRSSFHESMPDHFQNVLKIVRSPYHPSVIGSGHDSHIQTTMHTPNESVRSSHNNNGHVLPDFHGIPKTIFV